MKFFNRFSLLLQLLIIGVFKAKGQDGQHYCYADTDDGNCEAGGLITADDESTTTADNSVCTDDHEHCSFWAGLDPSECDNNPNYMRRNCRKSCGLCAKGTISTNNTKGNFLDFGEPQNIVGDRAAEIKHVVEETVEYMQNVVMVDPRYKKVRNECKNRHKDCSFWKLVGECEDKPGWMHVHCAPACQTCEMLEYENRCPMQAPLDNAWGAGDLNRMFDRIVTDEALKQYSLQVLSRPDDPENPGPWMVQFDNFATPDECERLIHLGAVEGYKRSSDVGKEKFDGSHDSYINKGRTSTNAWCQNDCYDDPIAKNVIQRISTVTNIPEQNSEYLQLLKYEVSQFYQPHNDYIPHETQRQQGNRLLTLYIYLNDVEEGGGTKFPVLNKTVIPKQGRAVLWPSVLDEDPTKQDSRTLHTALPVIKGQKYGANAWIHMRDFKTPNHKGCQ